MATHEPLTRRAIELAERAVQAGNHPFGALLVSSSGQVLIEAQNAVFTERDPTRHAELVLVSAASRTLDRAAIADATLYTSCEPCMMCCGALYWCGVRRVVYSCSHTTLAKHAGAALLMASETLLGNDGVHVEGPILESLGEELHKTFWKSLSEKH